MGIGVCLVAARGLLAQGGGQQQAPQLPPPINLSEDPFLRKFVWRGIGPAVMGGRIDDIAVDESNPYTFYIGYATGGIWKTENNGTTFTPIFDTHPVASIGDIAIAPSNPNVLYVGTGEPNNRQSSSFGGGVYKSIDGGKTFEFIGLRETQTIAKISVHPKDPNIVYVAATGHLFGPNPERGVYKTTDGGKSWLHSKPIDADTGFVDLVMHPTDPNTLFAASYQRRRQPWGFNGGGAGSALWKTTDAGRTWTKMSGAGWPANPIIGRIGIDICRAKPNVVFAQIEVGPSGGTGAGVNADGSLVQPGQRGGGPGAGGRGRGGEQEGPPPPPNPDRSGVWRSDDGGKSWTIVSNNNNRPMYYSKIRCDPSNDQNVYTLGAGASKSADGGKTFRPMGGQSHGDHHTLWVDPRNGRHLIIGNDGGIDVSYDQGETWEELATMPTGQFYAISADMRRPYYVCGGLQDNGSWCGPSAVRSGNGILNSDWFRVGGGDGFYTANDPRDWTVVYSESQDGNTNRLNLRDGSSEGIRPRAALTEEQRKQLAGGRGGGFGGGNPEGNIVPPVASGTNFRFYWSTPFLLSPHNPDVVWLGGDRLFRSNTRGESWTASPDLTRNIGRNDRPIMGVDGKAPMASKHDGAASYSNIVTLGESPAMAGVVWVGTNDGNVQVSRDHGATWTNVTKNITGVPDETHVSRVEPSHVAAGTCYVTFDNHRRDDHKPYVVRTTDFGATWTSIAGNLPTGNVNVIREDPRNPNLLYLGTEYALYISINGGKEWKRFMTGLPTVRIDDLLVHPRDNDLIVGTHGRSIWVLDDITPLQQMTEHVMTADAHLFDIRSATRWVADTTASIGVGGAQHFRGENPSGGTAISYYLKGVPAGDVKLQITEMNGTVIRDLTPTKEAGLNRVQWNLSRNPPAQPEGQEGRGGRGGGGGGRGRGGGGAFVNPQAVEPGTYVVKLTVGGKELIKTVVVEPDNLR
jgi:photosystem II stability/assembly factor-like uncharacterized protein